MKAVESISGWGLRVEETLLPSGVYQEYGEEIGCKSLTCNHISHDPAACWGDWTPLQGVLFVLGESKWDNDSCVTVYLWAKPTGVSVLWMIEERSYWAYLTEVPSYLIEEVLAEIASDEAPAPTLPKTIRPRRKGGRRGQATR